MNNETLCWVPYKEINFYVPSGHVTYCCKHDFQHAPKIEDYAHGNAFLYNAHLHSIKDNLLKGNKIKICESCWKSEDKGEDSWRQTEGVIPKEHNNLESLKPAINYYNQVALYFDNTCDMKCVYCGPWLSSKWESEQKHIKDNNLPSGYLFPDFTVNRNKELTATRIQRVHEFLEALGANVGKTQNYLNLTILGGEPLLSPEIKDSNFLKYIDSFFKHADKDFGLIFTIHTNGNTPKKVLDRFLNDIKKAKATYRNFTLKIIVSMDTIGKASEYIRSGSNWDLIKSNIDTYFSSDVVDQMGFSPTLSIFSISTIEDLIDYWIDLSKQHNAPINMSVGVVYNPNFMSPYYLTSEYADNIKSALDKIANNTNCFTEVSLSLLNSRLTNLKDKISNNTEINNDVAVELSKFLDYTIKFRNQDAHLEIPNMVKLTHVR